ncbi:hypothetical protein IJ114_00370, partial [Candidatus Saccharibacteria bacterium]|nr:hypothetical protein [Candidatus Saccharibacteria bacterium]
YYDGKMCDLELVPQKLVKPSITKVAISTLTPAEISYKNSINAKKNKNSPWRQFNPNFTNRDRTEWDNKNVPSRW